MIRHMRISAIIAVASCLLPFANVQAASAVKATGCDAACLSGLANRYMDAMVRHEPRGLPWAARVGYAENGVKVRVGESTWATIDARSATPVIVADPASGHVMWIGTINDHGQPAYYAMDMKIVGGKIAAVQAVIRRKEGRQPFSDPLTFKFDLAFGAKTAPGARPVLAALAQTYLSAQAGGKTMPSFASGCKLIENGVAMTGNLPAVNGEVGDCAQAFRAGLFKEFEAVRSSLVVDAAHGLVAAIGYRDLPGAEVSFMTSDGKPYAAEAKYPRSVAFVTLFKIEGGKIARVATVGNEVPYLMPQPFGR